MQSLQPLPLLCNVRAAINRNPIARLEQEGGAGNDSFGRSLRGGHAQTLFSAAGVMIVGTGNVSLKDTLSRQVAQSTGIGHSE